MLDHWSDMKCTIDETIKRMVEIRFVEDPILGRRLSYAASVAGSTQKRHGLILEKAILLALKRYESSNFKIWDDPLFKVSRVADNMVNATNDPYTLLGTDVPYGDQARVLQTDLIVYDNDSKHISAYEIKRGNSVHDSGKKRSILRDFVCTSLLIKGYGESRGLVVKSSSVNIIFYYGKRTIPRPHSLSRDELDAHFGRSILDFVEKSNDYFRNNVMELIG